MINKDDDGELVCSCDDCGDEYYGGCHDDFREFVDEVKGAGWLAVPASVTKWSHYCPDCREGH